MDSLCNILQGSYRRMLYDSDDLMNSNPQSSSRRSANSRSNSSRESCFMDEFDKHYCGYILHRHMLGNFSGPTVSLNCNIASSMLNHENYCVHTHAHTKDINVLCTTNNFYRISSATCTRSLFNPDLQHRLLHIHYIMCTIHAQRRLID